MTRRLTCDQVVRNLTELSEGALSLAETLRLRLHLLHCPECRELNAELQAVPEIMQRDSESVAKELLPMAQNALRAALARIAESRPPHQPQASRVPLELTGLLQSGADMTLRIMETVHKAFTEGAANLKAPFLPASVLALLPSSEGWHWETHGTARIATLIDGGPGGPRLSLLVAPRGFQTPSHIHFGNEQMLVLDGLLEDGLKAYPTGHWAHFGEGSAHAPIVLNDECWCLIRETGTIRYTGPLGWLRNFLAA